MAALFPPGDFPAARRVTPHRDIHPTEDAEMARKKSKQK
jgi:hypothetical protein